MNKNVKVKKINKCNAVRDVTLFLFFQIKRKTLQKLLYFSGKDLIWTENHFGEAEKIMRAKIFFSIFKNYLNCFCDLFSSSRGGGIKWKMPEIILISRGDSEWPSGLLLQIWTWVVYSVPHGTLSEGLRHLISR